MNLTEIGALGLEAFYIRWYGRKDRNDGILINKTYGGQTTDLGTMVVRDMITNKNKRVLSTPENKIQYNHVTKGTVPIKAFNGMPARRISLDDPDWIAGKYEQNTKGTVPVYDKLTDTFFRVDVNDSRYINGELVHSATGITLGKSTFRDIRTGKLHFLNINDEKLNSGFFVGHSKGKIAVRDLSTNKCFSVDKSDERYLSGQLIGTKRKYIFATVIESKEIIKTSINDIRLLTGEIVHLYQPK